MMNKNKLMMISLLVCGSINLMSMDADMAGEVLYNAVLRGNLADVQAAIAAGANLNLQDNRYRQTALIQAAISKNFEIAQALIEARPNLNVQDITGSTALMYAVRSYYILPEIAQALITAGADLNVRDDTGQTALMYAFTCARTIVEALITAGADLNVRDNKGQTALVHFSHMNETQLIYLHVLIGAGRLGDLQDEQDKAILNSVYDRLDAMAVKNQLEQEVFDGLDKYFCNSYHTK